MVTTLAQKHQIENEYGTKRGSNTSGPIKYMSQKLPSTNNFHRNTKIAT